MITKIFFTKNIIIAHVRFGKQMYINVGNISIKTTFDRIHIHYTYILNY